MKLVIEEINSKPLHVFSINFSVFLDEAIIAGLVRNVSLFDEV